MLFATENLPYWMFLGLGGALFLAILFGNKAHYAPAPVRQASSHRAGHTQIRAGKASPPEGAVAASVVPGRPRKPYTPLVLRLALNLTIWGLLGWAANVAIGVVRGAMPQSLLWVAILTVTLIAALVLSHQLMAPIGWVITSRSKTTSFDYLVGCSGVVSAAALSTLAEGVNPVDVVDPTGNTLTVDAALPDWATIAPQLGDRVTLIERPPEAQLYYAVAADSVDQDHWLKQAAAI